MSKLIEVRFKNGKTIYLKEHHFTGIAKAMKHASVVSGFGEIEDIDVVRLIDDYTEDRNDG